MVKRSLFYLIMMKWVTQGKRKSAALDLSQDKCRLSCFHSGRQENTTHACLVPGPSQSPWSGSSKTPEPMAVAGGQFWRLSSFEDHPLSTSGGQSFKHPLFAFLERKRLFWLSKALLLFSVGWGCTISISNLWFIHQDSCPSPCENAWSEDLFLPLNSFMLVKHLEENSQQCNCLSDYWLSILISPPLSPPLWLLLLIPEATDASSPLPSLDSGPEDLLSRHRIPPRLVFKSSTSFMFPDRQIHSTDKQWHSNPEGTRKCRSLLHWPSPFLTCWRKYGENTNWFPPFGSNGPVALGIFPSILQIWHAAVTAGSLWSHIYHVGCKESRMWRFCAVYTNI